MTLSVRAEVAAINMTPVGFWWQRTMRGIVRMSLDHPNSVRLL